MKQAVIERIMNRYNAMLAYCLTPRKAREITEKLEIDRSMTSDYCNILIDLKLLRRNGAKGSHDSTYETIDQVFTYEHFNKAYKRKDDTNIAGAKKILIESYATNYMLQMQANREAQRNRTSANVAIGSSFGWI